MDQSTTHVGIEMQRSENGFTAVVPGAYAESPYPLAYFFVVRDRSGAAWMFPGFEPDLSNQPYFTARASAFTD
jgi:hypothetical protein